MNDFDEPISLNESSHPRQRLLELAAGVAIGDLDEIELQELEQFDGAEVEGLVTEFESVASNLFLLFANDTPLAPIPPALARTIARQGAMYLQSRPASSQPTVQSHAIESRPETEPVTLATTGRRPAWRETVAWLCVAACVILLAGLNLFPMVRSTAQSTKELTYADKRQRLLGAADTVVASWEPGKTPIASSGVDGSSAVSGDVVWSTSKQEGYMTFRGLPVNNPSREQYQLWIVDPARDDKPVDGGVFDIPVGDGMIVIPIHAKLGIAKPTLFAVTIEKPGGVVVSSQERLPVLAKPEGK